MRSLLPIADRMDQRTIEHTIHTVWPLRADRSALAQAASSCEAIVSGPSKRSLAGHHLTEAIKHLYAAAEFVRETDREDSSDLAAIVERAAETARDVRGEIETKIA